MKKWWKGQMNAWECFISRRCFGWWWAKLLLVGHLDWWGRFWGRRRKWRSKLKRKSAKNQWPTNWSRPRSHILNFVLLVGKIYHQTYFFDCVCWEMSSSGRCGEALSAWSLPAQAENRRCWDILLLFCWRKDLTINWLKSNKSICKVSGEEFGNNENEVFQNLHSWAPQPTFSTRTGSPSLMWQSRHTSHLRC